MNVAKSLLLASLALPLVELALFVLVAAAIGIGWAFLLIVAGTVTGVMILRRAGGQHLTRVRVAMTQGSFTSLRTEGASGALIIAGILLVIPGFLTDIIAVLVLIGPLRRALWSKAGPRPSRRTSGVVDLDPEQWRHVPDPALPGSQRRTNDNEPTRGQ